ncbi:asparagine synthase (glutamine-hydrolyzing) [Rheinheimera sp. MMS21-TC3]|uniref:asparagine synthase (glutamine-hydrolyzing) n=1 Tax=Rheinheimera sp. MMS21-TC3 TaxID=3072790 RepID=UPI0028C47119|nr:asparagine synthase (glutamine-hydrolyzing) [Rheinheimera sp. MMS21-TC3]WNO61685.1 asparagine synthase (glutamine-hydrolyzing) [Rheinheimera sp. MMS21-TC3]
MCGFAGIWSATKSDRINVEALQAMGQAIVHRGPDDQGVWLNDLHSAGFVHRRLSIVDLSAAGHQPMLSPTGRYVIAFNGEIYNHLAIRKEIDSCADVNWQGHSDTETLLAAIDIFGLAATLEKLVGMFAFSLWDNQDNSLILVRDRLGEKPLYFASVADDIVFGSELSCIEAVLSKDELSIDRAALSQLIRQGYIVAPLSIYKEVKKLQPGQYVRFNSKGAVFKSYWSVTDIIEQGDKLELSEETAAIELEALLLQSLKDQMIADVPLGAFLSGGVDSSLVVALMQKLSDRPVKTYSIGFDDAKYDEAIFAKEVAKHLGTEHTSLYISDKQVLETVNLMADIYSEPFADSSQLPMYLVCAMAKQHVTVCLSGDGGDELFWGYSRYQQTLAAWQKLSGLSQFTCAGLQMLQRLLPIRVLNKVGALSAKDALVGDKISKALELLTITDFKQFYRSFMMASYRNVPNLVINGDEGLVELMLSAKALSKLPTEDVMPAIDLVTYLPDDILCKVDRAAMGVSLEGRIPLLDHRIVEFALKLPQAIKYKNKTAKSPLRNILYKYVPQNLIERPKKGFSVPLAQWLRNELKDWAEQLLDFETLKADGYFDPKQVHKLWQAHLSEHRNWSGVLWNILMFQAWLAKRRS